MFPGTEGSDSCQVWPLGVPERIYFLVSGADTKVEMGLEARGEGSTDEGNRVCY